MNDYRSPFGDKKLTLIGIFSLITVMVTVIFIAPYFYNKRYSDVEAAKAGTPSDVTEVKTNLIPAEIMMAKASKEEPEKIYLPSNVAEQKAKVYHQEWIESEAYLPDTVKIQKHKVEEAEAKKREEETIVAATTETPEVTNDVEVVESKEEVQETSSDGSYYGTFELTAYTWTGNPCADGVYPSSGYTVACNDPGLWHRWIYIEGYGTYYVHDTGGMASNVIDVYMDSYDACIQFGRRSANIYIVN